MNQHFGKHPCTTPAQATTKRIFAHPNMHAPPKSLLHSISIVSPYESGRAQRPHATSASLQQTYIYTPPRQNMHMHVPPNYSPSRFDAETRTRSVRCGRGGDYGEAHPHQLYINKSRFNTQNGEKYEQNGLGERRGTRWLEVGEGMKWVGVGGRCHLF